MPNDDSPNFASQGEPLTAGRLISPEPPRKLRVVLGVDPEQPLDGAIATVRQLAGHGLELHVVHIFDSRARDADLAKCRAALEAEGLGGTWIHRGSDPARGLIEVARDQAADIIAIAAPDGGGKVAKELLAHSPTHILVARRPPKRPDGLVAILATDHTDYMAACIDRLVQLSPSGIGELVVLTANEIVVGTAALLVNGLPQFVGKAEDWVTERIELENARIAARFAPFCGHVAALARAGDPKEVIEGALSEFDADLLIIGAEPHCFMDRLLFGSIAFDEVVSGNRSILALRA